MADKYEVLSGFNVKQEDGSEIRVEPGGEQKSVIAKPEKDKGGNEYLRMIETPMEKAVPIEKLLTAVQIEQLTSMNPPALVKVEAKTKTTTEAETTEPAPRQRRNK